MFPSRALVCAYASSCCVYAETCCAVLCCALLHAYACRHTQSATGRSRTELDHLLHVRALGSFVRGKLDTGDIGGSRRDSAVFLFWVGQRHTLVR